MRFEPKPTVKAGFIGVGRRGFSQSQNFLDSGPAYAKLAAHEDLDLLVIAAPWAGTFQWRPAE